MFHSCTLNPFHETVGARARTHSEWRLPCYKSFVTTLTSVPTAWEEKKKKKQKSFESLTEWQRKERVAVLAAPP